MDHLFDFVLGESTLIVGNGDFVGLSGTLVGSGDVQDTVGINIESDFDLGNTSGSGRDTFKVELAQQVVVLGHSSLTFEDLDEDTWLVVGIGGEDLGLLGGDGSISTDQSGHDTTSGLNTEGEGSNVQKEEVLDVLISFTGQDGSLDSSTVGDSFIGVDGSVKNLTVEEVGEHLLNLGDSGLTTDEDDFVDLSLGESGILEDVFNRWHALSEEIHAEFFELGS